jgi:RNA polymerase subunit RPABC4/transcription elongation factor Spt4/uncharacterized membrane protein
MRRKGMLISGIILTIFGTLLTIAGIAEEEYSYSWNSGFSKNYKYEALAVGIILLAVGILLLVMRAFMNQKDGNSPYINPGLYNTPMKACERCRFMYNTTFHSCPQCGFESVSASNLPPVNQAWQCGNCGAYPNESNICKRCGAEIISWNSKS